MIICNNCGAGFEDGMRFCSECGAKVPVQSEAVSSVSQYVESGRGERSTTIVSVDARSPAMRMPRVDSSVAPAPARNPRRGRIVLLALGAGGLLVLAGGVATWLIVRSNGESIVRGGPSSNNSNSAAFEAGSSGSVAVIRSASPTSPSGPYTPKAGSVERKMIMDALRGPVQGELTRHVIFKVDHLKIKEGWAFMRGVPKQQDGSSMNYRGTKYQSALEEGSFDDSICALLQQQGSEWRVVTFVIGATDVAYEGWAQKYKAPSEIFR